MMNRKTLITFSYHLYNCNNAQKLKMEDGDRAAR